MHSTTILSTAHKCTALQFSLHSSVYYFWRNIELQLSQIPPPLRVILLTQYRATTLTNALPPLRVILLAQYRATTLPGRVQVTYFVWLWMSCKSQEGNVKNVSVGMIVRKHILPDNVMQIMIMCCLLFLQS